MIWHFLEVWVLVLVAFSAGCAVGAWLYGLLADSPLALAQGAVADGVGDVVEWVRSRLGLGPAWRPQLVRSVARQLPAAAPAPVAPPVRDVSAADAIDERFVAAALFDGRREESRFSEPRELLLSAFESPAAPPLPEWEVAPVEEPQRAASAKAVSSDGVAPMRPAGLAKPRGGVPDNLTRIRGIGRRNEELLNTLGIYHFGQIASWTPGEVRWIGQYLAFPERIERDNWVGQAMVFATGGDTGFEKSADRRRKRRAEKRQQETQSEEPIIAAELPAPAGDDGEPNGG